MAPNQYSHIVLILDVQVHTRCQWREGKEDSGKAIGEMTALRWEPTHITKPNPRVVPLQGTQIRTLITMLPNKATSY